MTRPVSVSPAPATTMPTQADIDRLLGPAPPLPEAEAAAWEQALQDCERANGPSAQHKGPTP